MDITTTTSGVNMTGSSTPMAYWHVPDLEAKPAEVTAVGATVKEPAHDVETR